MRNKKVRKQGCRDAVLQVLQGDDVQMTARELAALTGYNRQYTVRVLEDLNKEKLIVIRDWQRTRSSPAPIYEYRRRKTWKDAPRPRPMTGAEISQRYRDRNKAKIEARRIVSVATRANPFGQLAGFTTRPRVFAKDQQENIIRMFNQGMGVTEIARELYCSPHTVSRLLKRLGLREIRPRKRRKDVEGTVIYMLESGITQRQIAMAVGCDKGLVGRIAKDWRDRR